MKNLFCHTDVASGDSFARTSVAKPIPGSGDGGAKGTGGAQGQMHRERYTDSDGNHHVYTVIDAYPEPGKPGAKGACGCVVVYWDKEGA